MPTWMLIAVYFAVVLLWWDTRAHREGGTEVSPPVLMICLSVFAAILGYAAIGPWGLIPVAVAMHSIHMKPNKWLPNTRSWIMSIRYALPAALSIAPSWFGVWAGHYGGLGYVGACFAAGIAYPALQRYAPDDISEDLTDFAVGCGVLGALVFL